MKTHGLFSREKAKPRSNCGSSILIRSVKKHYNESVHYLGIHFLLHCDFLITQTVSNNS